MPLEVRNDVPLAPFTTMGIGGPARDFAAVTTVDELREAIGLARGRSEPIFILGGGSNLLVADRGFDGLVVHVALRGMTVEGVGESATVRVAAGEPWDDFVALAVRNGWAGVECLSGIPGSVGATPVQNVGAYGQDVSETIVRVEVLDRSDGLVRTLTNDECRFGYRASLFRNVERERYVVTAVTFRLRVDGEAAVRYRELQKVLDERGNGRCDLALVRDAVIAIRRRKGMVLDPQDPDTRSDGSFFVNPVIPMAELDALRSRFGESEWRSGFPDDDGNVKVSAAWLIEHAGFAKGFVMGRVGLSTKHTLAITNRGGATAAEVVALMEAIQSGVRDRFGLELRPEPRFVGFSEGS